MPIALITGSGGLIGSESARFFAKEDFEVVGLDNDMRAYFFGAKASTKPSGRRLAEELGDSLRAIDLDIRDPEGVDRLFAEQGSQIELVVHTRRTGQALSGAFEIRRWERVHP
jgi:CDP-paratose 2-epimerase